MRGIFAVVLSSLALAAAACGASSDSATGDGTNVAVGGGNGGGNGGVAGGAGASGGGAGGKGLPPTAGFAGASPTAGQAGSTAGGASGKGGAGAPQAGAGGAGSPQAGAGGAGSPQAGKSGAGAAQGGAAGTTPGPACNGDPFPQGVPDPDGFIASASSYQDTDPVVDAAVNAAMQKLTGCNPGSDCPITGLPGANADEVCQSWFAAVTAELRAQGFCAGQHVVGSTDEIAVTNVSCNTKWYGYHVCNYGGPKVVWNPGARRGWWMIAAQYCD